jgi:hypothetical protein
VVPWSWDFDTSHQASGEGEMVEAFLWSGEDVTVEENLYEFHFARHRRHAVVERMKWIKDQDFLPNLVVVSE